MKPMRPILRSSLVGLWILAGCATAPTGEGRRPMAFHDTRLQYAILTEDREALKQEFQMNPERTPVERGAAGFALPFAVISETVFFPVFYGLSSHLTE